MKILHTADWHIGKVLHKQSLNDELELFFNWLLDLIKKEKVGLLLVSGDIFDSTNPSVKDRGLYYRFLSRLIGTGVQVIITGGNHDSVGLINAPQEILGQLNIQVIGGATENLEDELIQVKDKTGELKLVVAAVPFLRDRDLRNVYTDKDFSNRTEALKAGISKHYDQLADLSQEKYPGIPFIAMGHLYARGVSTSESEREIHIGNAAAVDSSIFSSAFDYVALGHIHRPQIIGGDEMKRYSGSPIALSFSEKEDVKSVLMIELMEKGLSKPKVIEVPKKRALRKIKGNLKEVEEKLSNYTPDFTMTSFVEVEVEEENFSSSAIAQLADLVDQYANHTAFKILKNKIQFQNGIKDTASLFERGTNIEDLSPSEVFAKRLEDEEMSDENKAILREAFMELFESLQQGD